MDFTQMLEKMDLGEIEKLKQAKQAITLLEGKRKAFQERIVFLDEQIAQIKAGTLAPEKVLSVFAAATERKESVAAAPKTITPKRTPREGTLSAKIAEVLRAHGGAMHIPEIEAAVRATGYETDSKNLIQQIRIALQHIAQVERVSRGIYRLQPSAIVP
jgi:hypothetical protein